MLEKAVPLKDTSELLPLKGLSEEEYLVEEQAPYFWVQKTDSDPLEWKCRLFHFGNIQKEEFLTSKAIKIKHLNKYLAKNFGEVIDDSYYRRELLAEIEKKHKTYTPIALSEISNILTGKTLEELNHEQDFTEHHFHVKGNQFHVLINAFDHYAEMWCNEFYIPLFYDDKSAFLKVMEKAFKKEGLTARSAISKEHIRLIEEAMVRLQAHQLSYQSKFELLQSYPAIAHILKTNQTVSFSSFKQCEFERLKGDSHITGDLILSDKAFIAYEGNLTVEGTLALVDSAEYLWGGKNCFIIITGDLTVDRLAIGRSDCVLIVLGKITIRDYYVNNYRVISQSPIQCATVIHDYAPDRTLPNINYKNDISPYTGGLLDADLYEITSYGSYDLKKDQVLKKVIDNEPFFDLDQKQAIDLTPLTIQSFISTMKCWDHFYASLAGFEVLDSIYEDHQIKGSGLYPGAGDWVVADRRGKTGTYGYSHDDGEIVSVTVKDPAQHDVDYSEQPIDRKVSTVALGERYQWMVPLFMDWAHRVSPSPYSYFDDAQQLNEAYENEKSEFENDPHLALYWLLMFGFSLDKRYGEVAEIARQHKLGDELDTIEEALVFFENSDAHDDIIIKNTEEAKDLFLKRRAFLVFITQSYSYRGGEDALDNWWKSITIYPHAEKNLVKRMRWLKNNLNKYHKWQAFDLLIGETDHKICLLSYVHACNPNLDNRSDWANAFIQELYEHKAMWGEEELKDFAGAMLWDVREIATERDLLRKATQYFFRGNHTSTQYQEILALLDGKTVQNADELAPHVANLEVKLSDYRHPKATADEVRKAYQQLASYVSELPETTQISLADYIKSAHIQPLYLAYLCRSTLQNKQDAIVHLSETADLWESDHLESLFGSEPEAFITGLDDPNLEIFQRVFSLPKESFKDQNLWLKAKMGTVSLFAPVFHEPTVFAYLMEHIDRELDEETVLYRHAVSKFMYREYPSSSPRLQLSQAQIECILDRMFSRIIAEGPMGRAFNMIQACETPLAADWFREALNNSTKFTQCLEAEWGSKKLIKQLRQQMEKLLEDIEATA
jgi:hypothetical protein